MSRADGTPAIAGPETQALLATRRWLVVVSVAIAGGFTLLIGLSLYPRLTAPEHAVMLVGGAALALGLVGSRRPGFLWFAVLGFLVLAAGAVLAPGADVRWLPLTTLIIYSSVYSIMLAPRTVGLVVPFVAAALLAIVWAGRPTNIFIANLALLGGWIAVLQLLLAGLLMWWAWNGLRSAAEREDADYAAIQESTSAALQVRERARLWRSTAAHLHESVLNSIRYVLNAEEVDRGRLAIELGDSPRSVPTVVPMEGTSARSLVAELQQDFLLRDAVTVRGWIPEVVIDPSVYEAVRAAAIELTRNAVRHGAAGTVFVSASLDGEGWMALRIEDDGALLDASADPGLGRSTVLGTSLDDAGVQLTREALSERGGVSVLRIPPAGRPAVPLTDRSFDMGRILVTSPLAGMIAAGSLYFVHMAIVGPLAPRLAGLLGLIGAIIAVTIVLRRQRVHPSIALALVVAPAMVPWFLLGDQYTCVQAGPLSPVLNTAGYSIMVIAAWSGRLPGVVGILIWGVSGALLVQTIPEGCRDSSMLALLNSMVALPLIIAVTSAGARADRRAQQLAQDAHVRELVARSAADAELALNGQLEACVHDAERLLASVAAGADVEGSVAAQLQQLDARIRAGIQVDPQVDGALAVMAKSLVDVVSERGRTVSVRALAASSDRRPVPSQVQGMLFMVMMSRTAAPPRLRVFTDGEEDHLSLVTAASALGTTGLRPGRDLRIDDVTVDVEDVDDERVAIIVSRPIQAGSLSPAAPVLDPAGR